MNADKFMLKICLTLKSFIVWPLTKFIFSEYSMKFTDGYSLVG